MPDHIYHELKSLIRLREIERDEAMLEMDRQNECVSQCRKKVAALEKEIAESREHIRVKLAGSELRLNEFKRMREYEKKQMSHVMAMKEQLAQEEIIYEQKRSHVVEAKQQLEVVQTVLRHRMTENEYEEKRRGAQRSDEIVVNALYQTGIAG